MGTHGVAQNPQVHGVGFVGTGAGWTLPTHAVPVCHPSCMHHGIDLGVERRNIGEGAMEELTDEVHDLLLPFSLISRHWAVPCLLQCFFMEYSVEQLVHEHEHYLCVHLVVSICPI